MNAPAPAPLTIEILEGRDAFLALRAEWDELFAAMDRPHAVFQSHVFLRHWAAHYAGDGSGIRIVAGRSGGRLVMAWPLILRRRMLLLRELAVMGGPVAQFADILLAPSASAQGWLRQGWNAVAALRPDIVTLRKLRDDAPLAGLDLSSATTSEVTNAPFALLARRVDAGEPSAAYPARERSNFRRRLRRLAERGTIAVDGIGPGTEAKRLAAHAITMKRSMLQRHAVLAPTLNDARFEAFFASLAADPDSPLRITTIRLDGEPIGIDLSLDCGDTAFGHVISTHPDHERGGVGGILVHLSFARALARGRARFDMLAPADPYKLDHADGVVGVSSLSLPLSWRGRALAGLLPSGLQPRIKGALGRLPPSLKRRLALISPGGKG